MSKPPAGTTMTCAPFTRRLQRTVTTEGNTMTAIVSNLPASTPAHRTRGSRRATWLLCAGLLGTQGITGTAAEAAVDYLGDHPGLIISAQQSWGVMGFNVAAHAAGKPGEALSIGSKSYAKGIGHHANGTMIIMLDGEYAGFDAEVGLQPCGGGGSVTFRVLVDGQCRFDSGVVKAGAAPKLVHVALDDAGELRLESADSGDGVTCDMANWANARLTRAGASAQAKAAASRVDIARFARLVTWDPNRMDGSRAKRTEEFPANEVFLETDVVPGADGAFVLPVATNGLGCVGLQWLNQRILRELSLQFVDASQLPAPTSVRVERWAGESAWQGRWHPMTGTLLAVADRLVFQPAATGKAADNRHTRKVRWILPAQAKPVRVRSLSAFSNARWANTNLVVQVDGAAGNAEGDLRVYNGEVVGNAPTKWTLSQPRPLTVRYSRSSALKTDATVLQFRLPTGAFGVAVEDVLANECVYLPEHGLFVTRDPAPVSLADYKRRVAARKTILQEVRAMPDQTFAQAMAKTHHDAQEEGPVTLSLACDNAKLLVARDGLVQFYSPQRAASPPAQTANWRQWTAQASEFRPQLGQGKATRQTRRLEGGWLPVPLITTENGGLVCRQRTFVAPCDEAGNDPARLNRRSVRVAEFTITNPQETATNATFSLTFLARSGEKKPAQLTACARGFTIRNDQEEMGLVLTDAAAPLQARAVGGVLTLSGSLPAGAGARCVVLLPAQQFDAALLSDAGQLRKDVETYWRAVLAPATQIETPDELLNNVIRSSQVRCLIAARNEADGARIAPWIAAMIYGPLESEAHSIIRGMDFLGHADFAQRSLDFFIHRYNTNGFLTTGYTTFGTPWHLWTLGEHYQLNRDTGWLGRVAPEVARASQWIIRQTAKTMKRDAAGQPLPEYGLMPPGVLADWNSYAYHFDMSAYCHAALREVGAALADIGDPQGAAFGRRAVELRENLLHAYHWTQARSPALALRDGTWVSHYPSQVHSPGPLADYFPGQDAGRSWCYDVELGAHQLVPAGVLDLRSREVDNMMNHLEDGQFLADGWHDYPAEMNKRDWFNLGGFSKVQPYYTRNAEIYAMRDEVKPFIRSYFNTIAAMLNTEVLTLWEHFHHVGAFDKTHETGYFLQQSRFMLVMEHGEELWLAPLITSNWLKDGQGLNVANAPTRFGPVSYRINSHVKEGVMEAHVEPPTRSAPKTIVLRLRHPDGKALRSVTVNGKRHKDFDPKREIIRLPAGSEPLNVQARY